MSTALTDRLWGHMTRIYGHKWISSFGEIDDDTWARGLAGVTATQLGHGLSTCLLRRDDPWPPTLVEFRALCLPDKAVAPYHRPFGRALAAPKASPAQADEYRRKIRAAVGL